MAEEVLRRELLERAAELRASCDERLQLRPRGESRKSPAAWEIFEAGSHELAFVFLAGFVFIMSSIAFG